MNRDSISVCYFVEYYKGQVLWLDDEVHTVQKVRSRLWPHQIRTKARLCRDFTKENTVILDDDEVEMFGLIDRPDKS